MNDNVTFDAVGNDSPTNAEISLGETYDILMRSQF